MTSYFMEGNHLPVENVSWHEAVKFCETMSKQTDRIFRLPSEAEWEFACRAGSTGQWCFGDDENLLKQYAWYGESVSEGKTHPVGQKKANAFGLFDMHGNVYEWCEDIRHDNYHGAPTDSSAWLNGGNSDYQVVRGGSRAFTARFCRSAYRDYLMPGYRDSSIGFRVVMVSRPL